MNTVVAIESGGSIPKRIVPRKRRAGFGYGRLFKKQGRKQFPPDWKGALPFFLAIRLDGGKRITQALLKPDGTPILNRDEAEAERMRIVGPLLARDKVSTLKAIQSQLADAVTTLATVEHAAVAGVRLVDGWATYLKNKARPDSGKSTLAQYAFQWGRFVRWMGERHPAAVALRDVTREHASEYADDLETVGLSGATINKHLGLLNLVFRTLADDAGITVDPWQKITRKKHRAQSRRELGTEELRRICERSEGELRLLLAIGIFTGLRLSDAATLRWAEVDLKRRVISRVPSKTARTSGKLVHLPIHATLAEMLQERAAAAKGAEFVIPATAQVYLARRDNLTDAIQRHFWDCGIDCHAPGTGLQIERDRNGNPIRNEAGRVKLKHTGKRAVLLVGFHSLRHSFVSLCRAAGTSLSVVESLVGHSNPTMTRLYSHTGEVEAARAVAMLPNVTAPDITTPPDREPLPEWAIASVKSMTVKTWRQVQKELLSP